MATKRTTEDVDLNCTVCLEVYKNPKLLPCGHTYCASCLTAIVKRSQLTSTKVVNCPQCRTRHNVPKEGTQAFLTNYTLSQEIEVREWRKRVAKDRSVCGVCEHTGETSSYCQECEAFLCSYCAGAHKRMKVFANHQVVPSDKAINFKPKPKPILCLKHPTFQVTFYCGTCSQLVCNECVVGSEIELQVDRLSDSDSDSDSSMGPVSTKHGGHELHILTDNSVKSFEANLEKRMKSVQSSEKTAQAKLQQLQELEEVNVEQVDQLKRTLTESVTSFVKALNVRLEKEMLRIDKESETASKAIQTHKKTLKSKLAGYNSSLRFAKKAQECGETVHKIAMMGQAMSDLNTKQVDAVRSKEQGASKLLSISQLCGAPLVVDDLEKKLATQGLLRQIKHNDIQLSVSTADRPLCPVQNAPLKKEVKLTLTFSVKPIGQPKFRIMYGGTNFQSELPAKITTDPSSNSWTLTCIPCCNGTHKIQVQVYGHWLPDSSLSYLSSSTLPSFNVEGTLEEGDIVRRTPNSKSTAASLFKEGEEKKDLSEYETGKLTKVERTYLGKSLTASYKVEVTWGHESTEPKTEELSFTWSEYSGFPLELVIPTAPQAHPQPVPRPLFKFRSGPLV